MGRTEYHGTTPETTGTEQEELLSALSRNCSCTYDADNALLGPTCGAHMQLTDQHALDDLSFGRWLRTRLLREEGLTEMAQPLAGTG